MARQGVAALVLCCIVASPAFAADPSADQLIFTGATVPGQNSLSFANNVYSFTFTGDETLTYQVDLSDPKVAGGMLRVREVTSDSYPIDGGGVVFRDSAGVFWFPGTNYKKTTLTAQSMSGNTLTLDFLLNFNGSHPFRYEISAIGKELRIRATDPKAGTALSNNFNGLAFGKSTGVETPIPIKMQGALAQPITMFRHTTATGTDHYFTANMLDMFQSNGSDYRIGGLIAPIIGPDSTTFGLDTATFYSSLSNGKLAAPLDDSLLIIVSSRIRDVLLDSTAPATPYHSLLSNRMFFDAPADVWSYYDAMFDLYNSLGMYNLAGYFFFDWTSSAVDPPSAASVGPDWSPAFDPTNFKSMLNHGTSMGVLLGAYTAFDCVPPTAPPSANNPAEIVQDSTGNQKTYLGLGFPLLGVEAAGQHAASETTKLKALGANAEYLDIQTYGSISKGPDGGHLDQKATSPWAKTMRQGYTAQKGWFETMRNTLNGPLLGEGSIGTVNSNMEFLYYGYADSTQRVINTGGGADAADLPSGSPFAPTEWPIIPEYEWRVAVKNQVNHGNGFYHRFFGPTDGLNIVKSDGQPIYPLTQDAMDLYQAFLISYGHAGYVITNGCQSSIEGYVSHPQAAQTYFMTNALQYLYLTSPITGIHYLSGGTWKTFEQIVFATESLDTFRHIPLQLDFQNGLKIYVNHGPTAMNITDGGLSYTLPAETGWYASLGNWLVSFSAIPPGTGGKRIDYCKATGQYEYFNGRGQVSGYGGITTTAKRSKWTVTPTNLTITEDTAGKLTTVVGVPPGFAGIKILPGSFSLATGERTGLKAVAYFDNGGMLDLTTLLHWYSNKPSVVTVNDAGIVTAVGTGDAIIIAIDWTGSLLSTPAPITVTVP